MTGIILSGGKSVRMGENKALIDIGGIPIIKRIHAVFDKLFEEIIIVTNEEELFENLNAKLYRDLIPNCGVLGGLYTGLFFSYFPYSFCVACDMPFLNVSVIEYLIQNTEGFDVVVPMTEDGLQPLHAIYSKSCLEPIKANLSRGKYKIIDLYPMVEVKVIEEDQFRLLDPMRMSFINVNTPEELQWIKEKYPL